MKKLFGGMKQLEAMYEGVLGQRRTNGNGSKPRTEKQIKREQAERSAAGEKAIMQAIRIHADINKCFRRQDQTALNIERHLKLAKAKQEEQAVREINQTLRSAYEAVENAPTSALNQISQVNDKVKALLSARDDPGKKSKALKELGEAITALQQVHS